MIKKIAGTVVIAGLLISGCATKKSEETNLFQKNINKDIQTLNKEIEKLYKLHVKECAPEEIGKAEAYIDAIDGLAYINPDTGEIVKTEIKTIDKILYKNKAQKYVALARNKVYSDVDGDGIPCYQEIEQGTNPFEAETKKVAKQTTEKPKKLPEIKPEYRPLKLHARIHFDFDKYTIKKDYLPYLNVITRYLKAHDELKVKIVGYTDSIGSKAYNDRLARKRAEAIKNYLVKHGISPERIEIIGKGKEDYLFDNKTPLNRFTNRRAEFFVMEPTQ